MMEKIRLARPCLDDPSKCMAEGHLGGRVDIARLCNLLKGRVQDFRCSVKLGVARFEMDGRGVMVYQSGRIDIRRVGDVEEAGRIIEKVRELLGDEPLE